MPLITSSTAAIQSMSQAAAAAGLTQEGHFEDLQDYADYPHNPTAMELRRANVDGTVGPPS